MSKTLRNSLLPAKEFFRLQPHAREAALEKFLYLSQWVQQYWFRLVVLGLLTFILLRKDLTFQLSLTGSAAEMETTTATGLAVKTSQDDSPVLSAEQQQQWDYVNRFAKVAQGEMEKFGIPASIILAQGLLETNAGKSPLASSFNNHFGMKCFSRSCVKGHCNNFADDSHKDFFRIYPTAWESYRAHSQLLKQSKRYESLFQLKPTDYKGWAKGLSKAGYATDKQYAKKLIRLIEELKLYEYDV